MRTFRFDVQENASKALVIAYAKPAGTVVATVFATNADGQTVNLPGAASVTNNTIQVEIPSSYVTAANFPARFEVRTSINGATAKPEVEIYGSILAPTPTSTSGGVVNVADVLADSTFNTEIDARVAEAVETHTPGILLGSAQRTTAFTSSSNADISTLSVTINGAGRPVEVSFFCSSVWHSVSGTTVRADLKQDGVTINSAFEITSSTALGRSMRVSHITGNLNVGQSYTFTVGAFQGSAGTMTFSASSSPSRPCTLTVKSC